MILKAVNYVLKRSNEAIHTKKEAKKRKFTIFGNTKKIISDYDKVF